jgi:hypothetical protein
LAFDIPYHVTFDWYVMCQLAGELPADTEVGPYQAKAGP